MLTLSSLRLFLNRDWIFETNRTRALWNKLPETDKELIPFDITTINWEEFSNMHFDGIHRFLLKTDNSPESLKHAQRRLQMYFIILLYFIYTPSLLRV